MVAGTCCITPDCPYFDPSAVIVEATSFGLHLSSNDTEDAAQCVDGLLVPIWGPVDTLSAGDRFVRALVYFLGLCYLFIGVSIIADRFMAAIEVITS
ncbi:unnamed protein product, partial [Notodromas monacha]